MKQAFLEAGRILTTHGLRGEVKFEYWGDNAAHFVPRLKLYRTPDGAKELCVDTVREQGRFLLLHFEGIADIDQAALLRGKTLYIAREDLRLPEDTVFWADLIGEEVRDADTNALYGHIREIKNLGASDLWEIETPKGETVLFPAVNVFVKKLSVTGALIAPPEGLF